MGYTRVATVVAVGLVLASGQAIHMSMDAKCANEAGEPLATAYDQEQCADCDGAEATAGPQLYGKCMAVKVVLAYNASRSIHESDHHERQYPGSKDSDPGTENQQCAKGNITAAKCPLHWNCGANNLACRNGLYCSNGTEASGKGSKCLQCANCKGAECGNCKTTFYPSVDEYSSFQIFDTCGAWTGSKHPKCNDISGCMEVKGKCLPGPYWNGPHENPYDALETSSDAHVLLAKNQEFFLEMGTPHGGHGIVRSPIAVYAQDDLEVTLFYAKIGMGSGYPRNIEWEQTGELSSKQECAKKITHERTVTNEIAGIKGFCATVADEDACTDTTTAFPATECGFSTFKGAYSKEGKFIGMQWPADTDHDEIPQAKHTDCNQNMCAQSEGTLSPIQFFVTWSGTDADGRPMISSGKSYQAFHLYQNSAIDTFKETADAASALKSKGSACIQDAAKC